MQDAEIGGKTIKKGDKVVMWYVSGNRDEEFFDERRRLRLERKNARNHLSFGFGIHRCVGMRLAEMQLQDRLGGNPEALSRRSRWSSEPVRTLSNFVNGYEDLKVRIPA